MLAAMPQAPRQVCTRSRAKERVTERRNYVLREMWQNGYIDEATYQSEKDEPLLSVQNGDYRGLPRSAAAARLFHRRNPPPAVGHLRRGGVLRRAA